MNSSVMGWDNMESIESDAMVVKEAPAALEVTL